MWCWVFSFIGMKTQEIVLKDDKPLKVVMQEDAKEIDEVVVTGIFNRKKRQFYRSFCHFRRGTA